MVRIKIDNALFAGILAFTLLGCFANKAEKSIKVKTINDLAKVSLGVTLSEIKQLKLYFSESIVEVVDTVFESEDLSWNGLIGICQGENIFILESNWEKPNVANSLEVITPKLKTDEGIGVSDSLDKLRGVVDKESWKEFPDGCLFFKDKENGRIIYEIDLSKNKELGFKGVEFDKLPLSLEINRIVIMNK